MSARPAMPDVIEASASAPANLAKLVAIVLPLLGVAAAPFLGWGFGWVDLALLVGMYLVSALGITVGFHRLFVHRSFEASMPVKFAIAVFGSMAVQGPLISWVAQHRAHHRHSDAEGDPHSPHQGGRGLFGWLRGFWHAHIGWFFNADKPELDRYVKDLAASPSLRIASRLFPIWIALGLIIPTVLGGLISGTWAGALTGLIWGGFVRVFLVHHVTWSVNSACHLWGFRPFHSDDRSRNNVVFGILALGEGWHNTHHAFPTSARHGLRWWEFDASYWAIRLLQLVGLAWNIKLPSAKSQAKKRRTTAAAIVTSSRNEHSFDMADATECESAKSLAQ